MATMSKVLRAGTKDLHSPAKAPRNTEKAKARPREEARGKQRRKAVATKPGVDRISRQLQLLRLIPTSPSPAVTTKRLAEELANDYRGTTAGEVSNAFIRKIQHDIEKLRALYPEIEVVVDEKRAHWIRWRPNTTPTTIRSMGVNERIAFGVLEKTGFDLLPRTSMKALKPYFEEARQLGPRWTHKIAVQPDVMHFEAPKISPAVESIVYTALLNDESFKIDYQGADGRKSTGVHLRPLALIRRNVRTYLVAQPERGDGPRTYALHRILAAAHSVVDVPKPAGFKLEQYLQAGIAHPVFRDDSITYGEPISLRLWADKDTAWLQETPLSKDQEVEIRPDGHIDVTATVPLTEELVRWLLSMADHVKVVAPEFLVRRVRDDVRRMHDLYAAEKPA